jgi:hypothetical protein
MMRAKKEKSPAERFKEYFDDVVSKKKAHYFNFLFNE